MGLVRWQVLWPMQVARQCQRQILDAWHEASSAAAVLSERGSWLAVLALSASHFVLVFIRVFQFQVAVCEERTGGRPESRKHSGWRQPVLCC